MPLQGGPYYSSVDYPLPDVSTVHALAASVLFCRKEFLRGGISGTNGPGGARPSSAYTTIVSSSDGVTAGAGDNLGGNVFTLGKWPRASEGTAHAWWVERHSNLVDGPFEVCFNMDGGGSGIDYYFTMVVAKGSGAFTGGSITNRPTATKESVFSGQFIRSSGPSAGFAHLQTDANGACYFMVSHTGSNIVNLVIGVHSGLLQTRTAGDASRSFFSVAFQDSGRGAPCYGSVGTHSTMYGMCHDGVTAIAANNGGMWQPFFNGGASYTNTVLGGNAIDGKCDELPVWPIFDNTALKKANRGIIPDLFIVGGAKPIGYTEPPVGTPELVVLGDIALAMDIVPTM